MPMTRTLPEDSEMSPVASRSGVFRPSERVITSEHEDRRTVLPATRGHPPKAPGVAEPGLLEGEAASGQEEQRNLSPSLLPEQRETLVDNGQGAVLPPVSSRASLKIEDGPSNPADTGDRSAPPAATPLLVPGVVRPRLDGGLERGPREPRESSLEPPAPTIRVNIGRIEVRANTPPPQPPAQPPRRVRSGPMLSLDEYLNQRNKGQR